MRRIAVLFWVAVMLFSGCAAGHEPPGVHITAAGEPIAYAVHKLDWGGRSLAEPDGFAGVYAENAGFKPVFYARGTEILLDFGDRPPDAVRVTDDVLQTTGVLMYLTRETDKAKHSYENGLLTIPIGRHGTSGRTCGFMAEGQDYRGYRVYATFGADTCCYDFIVLSES